MFDWLSLRRVLIQAAVYCLPTRRHAVVAAFPDDEGNGVEVIRALAERSPEGVYWLVDSDFAELKWLLEDVEGANRVRLVRKQSLRAFLLYATASKVFFTHGLFSSPRPPRKAVFVNLWHGDGPKRTANPNYAPRVPSTYIVAGTELWGSNKVRSFGLQKEQLLLTGNPRIDQFQRPTTDSAMRALNLDPARPLVIWMPTYRGTNLSGIQRWNDSQSLTTDQAVLSLLQEVAQRAEALGISLIVKPHPMDADSFERAGIRVLSSVQLRQARTGLYQLLARTSGLITDYSSVWTDYLVLDRPIGFYCPDMKEYIECRGFNVDDLPSLLPGPLLASAEDFSQFMATCAAGANGFRLMREHSVERIGAETRLGATYRLLDALNGRSR